MGCTMKGLGRTLPNGRGPSAAIPNSVLLDFRVEKVLQLVNSNPLQSLAELAQVTNLSPSRLRHLFRENTGSSLSSYLTNRRLNAAAELLLTRNVSVKEVTYAVGYCHEPSFIRAFTKQFGCSPSDYRRPQPLWLPNSRVS